MIKPNEYQKIGNQYGHHLNKTHTCVLHGYKKVRLIKWVVVEFQDTYLAIVFCRLVAHFELKDRH